MIWSRHNRKNRFARILTLRFSARSAPFFCVEDVIWKLKFPVRSNWDELLDFVPILTKSTILSFVPIGTKLGSTYIRANWRECCVKFSTPLPEISGTLRQI